MGNAALKEWAESGEMKQSGHSGRVCALAKHLGLTQPAVSKMINNSIAINFKYVEDIIEFTGISARDLLPEYYDLFKKSFKKDEQRTREAIKDIKHNLLADIHIAYNAIEKINPDKI